ncbi:hypothetical protein Tco_1138242, partial [Tanacetum coccineum]
MPYLRAAGVQKALKGVFAEGFNFLVDFWEWVAVFWAPLVLICEVYTHPPAAIVFLYHYWENMSKLSFSRLQSSILPFSDKLPPIVMVCSGYSGWIATFTPSAPADSGGRAFCASATILHSA